MVPDTRTAGARSLESVVARLWFGPPSAGTALARALLSPLAAVVAQVGARRRRRIAHARTLPRDPTRPPVVVIGNLVAGGAGKTPLLIALVEALTARGWRPGVLARGYRSRAERAAPRLVGAADDAAEVGDEPLLVARRTGRPVAVGRDRAGALALLAAQTDCDVVLSDDGLQHERLPRDLEIAVFDARGAGNRRCLPAGPLREPLSGALLLDAMVLNGEGTEAPIRHSREFRFRVEPTGLRTLDGSRDWTPAGFAAECRGTTVDAIAGIGAPQRFFDTLAGLGVALRPHPLADHVAPDPAWLAALPGPWRVMTEKDAVKCASFDAALRARCVALRIDAVPDAALVDWLEDRLRG